MQIQMYHKNLCSQVSKLQNFVKRYLKWTLGPTEALSGWRKCLFAICLSDPMLSSAIYLSIYRSVDQVNGRSWRWPNFLWDQQIKLSKSSSSSSGHASILARTPPIDLFLSFKLCVGKSTHFIRALNTFGALTKMTTIIIA